MKNSKKILIVLLIILFIFLIFMARKIIIIKNLQNKISEFTELQNYYIKAYSYKGDSLHIAETYKSNENSVTNVINITENNITKLNRFNYNGKINTYIEKNNSNKVAILDTDTVPSDLRINNMLQTQNTMQLIKLALFSSIESEECNGKQCYKIDRAFGFQSENEKTVIYIDKETGLIVRIFNGTKATEDGHTINLITDYAYNFDSISDEIFKQPDISNYQVQ